MKTSIKTIGLLAVLAMGLTSPLSPVQAAEHFWDEIPLSPSTTMPSEVLDDYWNSEFQRVNREVAAAKNTRLVFFGDSITWSWSLGPATGREIWENQFKDHHPINMGNSGDITPVMLHRVTRGNLDFPDGRHPKVAVILCGINNFGVTKSAGGKEKWDLGPDCPPEDIAQGQRAIAQVFRRKLPQTRVIMMALLPVADRAKWQKCQRVNAINAKLALDSDEVAYINLQDSFLQPDGTINKALFTDGTHLTKEGYQAWEKGISPVIGKFMKAPPLAPVRIMLIGGSATEGLDSSTSYRRYLDGMIRRNGHLSDFIGSQHKHKDGTAEPDSYQFDPDHEGHWGKDSEWIADNMPHLLERNVPDLAVIHLGAEDILANKTEAGPLTDGIIKNIGRVITALRLKNAKVKIVIAQNLPVRGSEETCVLLNQKISRLARSSASTLSPVVFAEANQRFEPHHDMSKDDALPNASGARKIAGILSNAINTLLGPSSNVTVQVNQSVDRKLAATPPQLKPPLHGLEEVGWQNVNLRGGFWGPRLDIHHKTTIPHVIAKLDERKHIANFDIAARVLKGGTAKKSVTDSDPAGKALEGDAGNHGPGSNDPKGAKDGEITGHSAFDSDLHKALEGACYTLGHCDDPALSQRVEGILDRIVAAQEEDGYLVSYFTAKEPENKWANLRLNHEMYNAGHFFEFAVAHHQLTGKTKALDAAKRFADHIDRTFGHGKRYDVDGHQEVELALVKLYRATGEKRYLDLCRFLLEERGHLHGTERKPFTEVIPRGDPERKPGETMQEWRRKKWSMRNGRMQDHKPVLEQTEAVGHAVRAGYMYAAMADLARFSEAPEYAKAVRTLWDDVLRCKFYLTGGLGTAQYGDEGFGDPYLLPNNTYCESCANMANVLWQYRMNLMDGHAKYADVMELALYNSAIAGLALSGKGFFYQNPLESRNGAERSVWIGLACCPTSHARFTPQVGGLVYARKAGKILVNLYAAGEATIGIGEGRVVKISQKADYPWDGRIKLTIAPDKPSEFDLCVRIPGWALGKPVPSDLYRFASTEAAPVSLKINGESVEAKPGKDGYVHLARSWKAGDEVALDLPMPVRRVHAHEKVEADKGKVALMRGPLVYCVEAADQPDLNLFQLILPRASEMTARHRRDLLGGVTVLEGEALAEGRHPIKMTAIPYYAWQNRTKGAMTVWIQEASKP